MELWYTYGSALNRSSWHRNSGASKMVDGKAFILLFNKLGSAITGAWFQHLLVNVLSHLPLHFTTSVSGQCCTPDSEETDFVCVHYLYTYTLFTGKNLGEWQIERVGFILLGCACLLAGLCAPGAGCLLFTANSATRVSSLQWRRQPHCGIQ